MRTDKHTRIVGLCGLCGGLVAAGKPEHIAFNIYDNAEAECMTCGANPLPLPMRDRRIRAPIAESKGTGNVG